MNLSYTHKKKASEQPHQFKAMKTRALNNQQLYIRKTDLRESLLKLLVPEKDALLKQKNCDCGPNKISKSQDRANRRCTEWSKRLKL